VKQEPHQTTPDGAPAPQAVSVAFPNAAPYATYLIIGVTVFVFLLQGLSKLLLDGMDLPAIFFIKSNELIRSWQVWRLVTPILLHGNILHIGLNMYALFSLGTGLERHFGHGRFILLYLIGAFVGNVASLLLSGTDYSLGAGTAIFGLLSAEGVFLFQNRRLFGQQARRAIGNVIFIGALNLFILSLLPGVDIWANIGGLFGGLFFAWYAGPLWDIEAASSGFVFVDRRSMREVILGALTVAAVFSAVAVWWIMR
jgi:rhomboid protease GluP